MCNQEHDTLEKLAFNIRSSDGINLPSNDEVQQTSDEFENGRIISYVEFFKSDQKGCCHIYSYLYRLEYFHWISNGFPGGLFRCVREISLCDNMIFSFEFLYHFHWCAKFE